MEQKLYGKYLLATVGLPRSGKTIWAMSMQRLMGWPIVNPDSIRLALHGLRYEPLAEPYVWAIAGTMVRALFLAGHEVVVLDAANISRKRRDQWQSKDWVTQFKLIKSTKETCLERAKFSGDDVIIPVIERMAGQHEILGPDEIQYTDGKLTAPVPA